MTLVTPMGAFFLAANLADLPNLGTLSTAPVQHKVPGTQFVRFRDSHGTALAEQVFLHCFSPDFLTICPPLGVPIPGERRNALRTVPADSGMRSRMAYPCTSCWFPASHPLRKILLD